MILGFEWLFIAGIAAAVVLIVRMNMSRNKNQEKRSLVDKKPMLTPKFFALATAATLVGVGVIVAATSSFPSSPSPRGVSNGGYEDGPAIMDTGNTAYDRGYADMQTALNGGLTIELINAQYGGPFAFCSVQASYRAQDTSHENIWLTDYQRGCSAAIADF